MTYRFTEFVTLIIFGLSGNHVAAIAAIAPKPPSFLPPIVKPIAPISTQLPPPATHLEPVYVPPAVPPPPPAPVINCGSDSLMAVIYQKESGCNTAAYNPGGCRGLGQACPGSKLPCSDYDWACQDNWFRSYAVQAYGSIYNAYLFRISHNFW